MDKKLEGRCDELLGLLKGAVRAQKAGDTKKAAAMNDERIALTNKTVEEPQYVHDSDKELLAKAAYHGVKPIGMRAITKDAYGRPVVNQRLHEYHKWSDTCRMGIRAQQHKFDRATSVGKAAQANLETLATEGRDLWREYIQDGLAEYADLVKADVGVEKANVIYTTNTGYGAEWIPEIWSRDLIDIPHLPFVLLDNLPQIKMPTKKYTYGAFNGDPHFLIGSEQTSTDPGSRVGAVDVATREVNFVAKKLEARVTLSTEETEDAIFNAVAAFSDKLRKAAAYDFEDVVINGDDSANHMDSDVTVGTDRRKLLDGLRRWQKDNVAATDLGTLTLAKLAGLRVKLGDGYQGIEDLLYVGSPTTTIIIGAADIGFKTLELLGPKAFILTGQVGTIAGVPYIESQKMRSDLNALGYYDGTTETKAIVLLVHRPSVGVGYYKSLELMVVTKPEYDLIWVIGRMRVDLQPMHAASDDIVALGYNMA